MPTGRGTYPQTRGGCSQSAVTSTHSAAADGPHDTGPIESEYGLHRR